MLLIGNDTTRNKHPTYKYVNNNNNTETQPRLHEYHNIETV